MIIILLYVFRVTVVRSELRVNATITNIRMEDAGVFKCVRAYIELRVTEVGPGKVIASRSGIRGLELVS